MFEKKKSIPNEKLTEKRKSLGMTQIQLAQELNVSSNTICHYETGKRKPRGDVAKKLSEILDLPLEDII